MRQKTFMNIALALALAATGSAFAQGNSRHDRGNNDDCRNGNCVLPDQRQRPSQNADNPFGRTFSNATSTATRRSATPSRVMTRASAWTTTGDATIAVPGQIAPTTGATGCRCSTAAGNMW